MKRGIKKVIFISVMFATFASISAFTGFRHHGYCHNEWMKNQGCNEHYGYMQDGVWKGHQGCREGQAHDGIKEIPTPLKGKDSL